MHKIIFSLLFSSLTLFATSLIIQDDFAYAKASPYMEYIADKNDSLSFDVINNVTWKKMVTTNLGGNNTYYSWTRFKIYNASSTNQNIILKNPRAGMDEIDLYITNAHGTKFIQLGDNRNINNREILHRYSIAPIVIEPHENIEIVTKLINRIGGNEGEWEIYTNTQFSFFSLRESMWWGIFVGLTLGLFIYSLPFLIHTQDRAFFIYYCAYVICSLTYQMSVNGILYSLGFNEHYINFITLLSSVLFGLFILAVMMRFLIIIHYKKNKLWYAILLVLFFFCTELIVLIFAFFDPSLLNYVAILSVNIGFCGYFLWFSLLYELLTLSKNSIFTYFFCGYSAVSFAYLSLALVSAGYMENNVIATYGLSIGSLLEMYFFALAVIAYLHKVACEKKNQEKLLDIQLQFTSIGHIIANISHQWKVPLVRTGNLVTQIEALILLKNDTALYEIKQDIIPRLQINFDFMQRTINEFYELYQGQQEKGFFSPFKSVTNVWSMLDAKAIASNVTLKTEISSQLKIKSYEHHFSHIMMILFDNAIEIARERKLQVSHISVSIHIEENFLVCIVEDTCGGIYQTPLESIFELEVTSKNSDLEQNGMGLFIIKALLEIQLCGDIHVSNTSSGTKFEIRIAVL